MNLHTKFESVRVSRSRNDLVVEGALNNNNNNNNNESLWDSVKIHRISN